MLYQALTGIGKCALHLSLTHFLNINLSHIFPLKINYVYV